MRQYDDSTLKHRICANFNVVTSVGQIEIKYKSNQNTNTNTNENTETNINAMDSIESELFSAR